MPKLFLSSQTDLPIKLKEKKRHKYHVWEPTFLWQLTASEFDAQLNETVNNLSSTTWLPRKTFAPP